MHSSPGVYALLVGSGISVGSGVATGWDVIQALVRKMAAVATPGRALGSDFDVETWWNTTHPGIELGYDSVLEASTLTAAERRRVLEPFFLPTAEDLEAGRKVPAAAHQAIAQLVKRGTVRVVVTTNFDDLIEKALDEIGAPYQVIATPSAIEGSEALRHSACTVIKVHGDYSRIDVLNTADELAGYHQDLDGLLDQVFDEYGLLVCGWSADWDTALVDAIRRAPARRYPLYWATRGDLGGNANELIGQRRGMIVPITDADRFFTTLAERLGTLDRMANPPLTLDFAVGQLKRCLPDPVRRLDLRDLFDQEILRLRDILSERPLSPETNEVDWGRELDGLSAHVDIINHLLAHGIILDNTRDHDDLWIWVIEQLMRACPHLSGGRFGPDWQRMLHYPAWLALMTASFAAVYAKRDDLLIRLFREPTVHDFGTYDDNGEQEPEAPASKVLYDYQLFSETISENLYPETDAACQVRKHTKDRMRPIFLRIVGNPSSFDFLGLRSEYRIALIQASLGATTSIIPHHVTYHPVIEYTCHRFQFGIEGKWKMHEDFTATADQQRWVRGLDLDSDKEFETLRNQLRDEAHLQKWG
ncbi:hypothetical protein EF834_08360 [Rhodococcus spongiicola]|uniref:Uncharacterized protein n=2 Tax=Rhodococcus spongiicola TaxID=2487352 RepID=A0A3S3BK04_9NOCA|nr:hypothetical protein EF834_08360 [Rhodococcus spongiicola]